MLSKNYMVWIAIITILKTPMGSTNKSNKYRLKF